MHILFHCPHAEVTWFASSLGIHTTALTGMDLKSTLFMMWQQMEDDQVSLFMTIAWNIWKERCIKFFDKRSNPPLRVIQMAIAFCATSATGRPGSSPNQTVTW